MTNTIIQRPALGQVATIGTLYDATSDTFLPRSIFDGNLPGDATIQTDVSKTSIQVNYVDTYKLKFQELGLSPELSASILAGLVTLGGSGHYLNEERDSNFILQAALHHKITTVHVKLNFMSNELKSCLGLQALSTREATHVVTELEWGAQSIVTARHRISHGVDRSAIEHQFRAQIQKFEMDVKTSSPNMHPNNNMELPLEVTVYGDFLAENGIMMDLQEAHKFLGLTPRNISQQNGGKGTPVVYTLVPVGMLPLFLPIIVQADATAMPPSPDCLQRFVLLFDQIQVAQQKLNDYQSYVTRHELYMPKDHIRLVAERVKDMKNAESSLKSAFARALQDVRSGVHEPAKLWDLLRDPRIADFSPQSIANLTESQHEKVEFINKMVTNGATYVGYNNIDVKVELSRVRAIDAYIFSFASTAMKEQRTWDGNQKLLLELLKDRRQKTFVAIVDEDARGNSLETSRISHFRGEKEVAGNMLEQRQFMAEKCFARYARDSLDTKVTQKPLKRRFVKIACPGSGCDHTEVHDWICIQCHAPIEYGYSDAYIYCDCGRSLYR